MFLLTRIRGPLLGGLCDRLDIAMPAPPPGLDYCQAKRRRHPSVMLANGTIVSAFPRLCMVLNLKHKSVWDCGLYNNIKKCKKKMQQK
jgi:hypothetical protein